MRGNRVVERLSTDLLLMQRLARFSRPYLLHILGLCLLSFVATPLTLLSPLPLKIAVDTVIGSKPLPGFAAALTPDSFEQSAGAMLALAAGLLLAVTLATQLVSVGTAILRTLTSEKLLLAFRAVLLRHVQRLSLTHHDQKSTADSIYRIQYDANAIQYIAVDGVIPFVTAGLTLVGMIYVTVLLDWQLALVALSVAPPLILIARHRRRRLRSISREVKRLESSVLKVVQEVLGTLRVVKAFSQEDREHERFVQHSTHGMRRRIALAFVEGRYGTLNAMVTAVGTATVLVVGVRHVQAGTLTLGDLLMVMAYIARLYEPLRTIGRKAGSLQSHLASAERAFELLDTEPDVVERPLARRLQRARGEIVLQNVGFSYRKGSPVLRDLSFRIPAGTRVGISGRTGAGKTTLASLVMRFHDPDAGRILLDGVDLRDYKLADLRDQFAIVLQEPVLFSTTIAVNIAYGRPDATQSDIEKAARLANAHDFILGLPEGYDTEVGERGMMLSGGERQRISLARAFLKDAPILILDEPTSSVDTRTESAIMEAMERLMQGRTTLIIAHRQSTLKGCALQVDLDAEGNLHGSSAMSDLDLIRNKS